MRSGPPRGVSEVCLQLWPVSCYLALTSPDLLPTIFPYSVPEVVYGGMIYASSIFFCLSMGTQGRKCWHGAREGGAGIRMNED